MNRTVFYSCIIINLFLLLTGNKVRAQAEFKKANEYIKQQDYALAIAAYQKELTAKEPDLAAAQNLAHAYRLSYNIREAENWFARVLTFPEHDPTNIYYYAEALRSNGKYAAAKTQYQLYATKKPAEAALINKRLEEIALAQSWLTNPEPVTLQLETGLNSVYADFSPVLFDNGLLFTSDRPVTKAGVATIASAEPLYLHLFFSKKEANNTWATPAPLDPLVNATFHNGPAAAGQGNTIYFTRTFARKEKKQRTNTDPTSWEAADAGNRQVNRLAIYSVEKRSGKYTNLKAFAYNQVAVYSVGHPALTPDGKYLYFVSDMPGGFGQTDIYFCERKTGGSWSKPVNAGPVINTSGRESFPVVHPNGTLYFSSDGHAGMGGLDLFSAGGSKANWKNVVNLKVPFNSPQDDFGLSFEKTGNSGYVSSNRGITNGTDDIYYFQPVKAP